MPSTLYIKHEKQFPPPNSTFQFFVTWANRPFPLSRLSSLRLFSFTVVTMSSSPNFFRRVVSLPIVSVALQTAETTLSHVKDSGTTTTWNYLGRAKSKLQPVLNFMDNKAVKSLDYIEEKVIEN